MRKVFSNAVVLFVIVAALVASFVGSLSSNLLPDGSDAPPFEYPLHAGGTVSLTALKGQVVLVDFWATWCPPCREELPWLVDVAKEYEAKGVRFVAVSHDEQPELAVTNFVKNRMPELGRFVAYGDPFTGGKYRVRALPTLYVIGKDGRVMAAVEGSTSEWRVRRWLEKAVAAAGP